ncbi:MAG: hypothetical protein II129_07750, partial [Paludibacteraceae bacterium]|nr:hypothetical protein [Paludibacteraceae bacterium]
AGSLLRKAEVEWENDECWVFPKYETDTEGITIINDYFLIDKNTGEQNIISKEELKKIKKK